MVYAVCIAEGEGGSFGKIGFEKYSNNIPPQYKLPSHSYIHCIKTMPIHVMCSYFSWNKISMAVRYIHFAIWLKFGNFIQSWSLTDIEAIFNLRMTEKSYKGWGPLRWHFCQVWFHLLQWFRNLFCKEKWTYVDGDATYERKMMTKLYNVLYSLCGMIHVDTRWYVQLKQRDIWLIFTFSFGCSFTLRHMINHALLCCNWRR